MIKFAALARASWCLGFELILSTLCLAQVPFAGDFQSEIRYPGFVWSIATGDFNGDGLIDFVASSSDNTIVVFLGNGDGTYQGPVRYGPFNDPAGVAIADLNGDGKLDVVVANFNLLATTFGGGVSVLFGNGDGTFRSPVFYTTGKNPTAVAVSDLNGDGKPDLVVTDVTSGNVSVLLNDGTGAFAAPVQFATGSYPNSLAIADINRDGHNDIVVTNSCDMTVNSSECSGFSPNTISVLLGNGDGTFQSPVSYGAGTGPYQLAVGDLNADGWPDIVETDNSGTTVSVLLNKGDGTFLAPVSYVVGHSPIWVVIADFNGDGRPDIVATTRDLTLVELLGNGDGSFQNAINYFTGSEFLGVAAADFNGDSRYDLVASTGPYGIGFAVGIFLNAGGISRAQTTITLNSSSNPALTLSDIGVNAQVTSAGAAPTGSVTLYVDRVPKIGFSLGQLNAAGQTSFDLGCLSMGNHTISAIYSGDTLTAGSANSITETVNLRPTTFVLSSSPNPSNFGTSVTLTGFVNDVSAASGTCPAYISGMATFSDGANVLGSSPVTASPSLSPSYSASLSVSSLSAGNHQITATYSGDQNYAAAVSSPVTQVVNASLGLSVASGGSSSATVVAGQSASYALSIGGAGFAGTATIACNLAVTGATCSAPATASIDQNVVSNLKVTVTTSPRSAAKLGGSGGVTLNWLFAAIFVVLAILPHAKLRGVSSVGLLVLLVLCGCGGGSASQSVQTPPTGTPPGTYNLTVTASSGTAHQSITLTLVVQ
jgi:hypothetical protein